MSLKNSRIEVILGVLVKEDVVNRIENDLKTNPRSHTTTTINFFNGLNLYQGEDDYFLIGVPHISIKTGKKKGGFYKTSGDGNLERDDEYLTIISKLIKDYTPNSVIDLYLRQRDRY